MAGEQRCLTTSQPFMNNVATVGPGSPAYAAPEACIAFLTNTLQKWMFLALVCCMIVEMCLQQFPESDRAQREVQIQCVLWPAMVSLVRQCTSENTADRPNTMELLGRI